MSEIIVVNTEEKSLKFYDIYDNNNNNFCIVNVNVKYLYYNQDIHADPIRYYYDITYHYEYYENIFIFSEIIIFYYIFISRKQEN